MTPRRPAAASEKERRALYHSFGSTFHHALAAQHDARPGAGHAEVPRYGQPSRRQGEGNLRSLLPDGKDGILNKHYYDLILGEDLSVYPSYYEPWGYTPLESVAFRVPTITTDLAGFGLWVNSLKNQHGINDGVEVLHRSDYNYSEVADGIKDTITLFSTKTDAEIKEIRKRAAQVAEQALWKHFIQYYYEAYDLALRNAMKRQLG